MAEPITADQPDGLTALPVRDISWPDIKAALAAGWDDFRAVPTHYMLIILIYPVMGMVLARLSRGLDILPLVFPLLTGFALVGPLVAVGLYVISKRRGEGQPAGWRTPFDVLKSPALGTVIVLGIVLVCILVAWLFVAFWLYREMMGTGRIDSAATFIRDILGTSRGWMLIVVGNLVGLGFAVATLAISVVSFPLAIDRNVPAGVALATSVRAVLANPVNMGLWGVVVVALLVLGALPLLVGLAVVMPWLGHATWHLYKRVVV